MRLPPNLKRLLAMVKTYRSRLGLALLCMAVTAATEPVLLKFAQLLFDEGFNKSGKAFPL
jgi:ABC-type multidrug transport system fused ATPase/permease subunit